MFRTLISPNQFVSYLGGGPWVRGFRSKFHFSVPKDSPLFCEEGGVLKTEYPNYEKKIRLLGDLLAPKIGQNGCFSAISSARTKNLFYSLFSIWQKYYESSKTEYSDSTSFINRLSLFLYKKSTKNVRKSAKNWPPDPPDPPKPIFLVRGIVLILTHAKKKHNFALWG